MYVPSVIGERGDAVFSQRFEFSFEPRFIPAMYDESRQGGAILLSPEKIFVFEFTLPEFRAPLARSREKWRELKIAQKVTEKLQARIVL